MNLKPDKGDWEMNKTHRNWMFIDIKVNIPNIFQNGNFTLRGFPLENSRSLSYLLGLTSQKGELTK